MKVLLLLLLLLAVGGCCEYYPEGEVCDKEFTPEHRGIMLVPFHIPTGTVTSNPAKMTPMPHTYPAVYEIKYKTQDDEGKLHFTIVHTDSTTYANTNIGDWWKQP